MVDGRVEDVMTEDDQGPVDVSHFAKTLDQQLQVVRSVVNLQFKRVSASNASHEQDIVGDRFCPPPTSDNRDDGDQAENHQ